MGFILNDQKIAPCLIFRIVKGHFKVPWLMIEMTTKAENTCVGLDVTDRKANSSF